LPLKPVNKDGSFFTENKYLMSFLFINVTLLNLYNGNGSNESRADIISLKLILTIVLLLMIIKSGRSFTGTIRPCIRSNPGSSPELHSPTN